MYPKAMAFLVPDAIASPEVFGVFVVFLVALAAVKGIGVKRSEDD